jgi:hypothetical protein
MPRVGELSAQQIGGNICQPGEGQNAKDLENDLEKGGDDLPKNLMDIARMV